MGGGKEDHRGRITELRKGEKGDQERGRKGRPWSSDSTVIFQQRERQKEGETERENRVAQRSAFWFLWQQQAIILNRHLL